MSDLEEGELPEQQQEDGWTNGSYDHAQSQHPARVSQQHKSAAQLPGWGHFQDEQSMPTQQPPTKKRKLKVKVKAKGQQGAAESSQAAAPGAALGYYDIYGGADARASIQMKPTQPVQLRDVQGLVLWVLGESTCPRWVFVKNKVLISRVVLVLAHGLTEHILNEHKESLTHLHSMGQPVVTLALNSTVRPSQTVHTLLNVPMSKKRKRETEEEVRSAKRANSGRPPFPPTHYVMSLKEMEAADFPVPELGPDGQLRLPEGHVATQPPPARAEDAPPPDPYAAKMVALDCEMCITEQGFELTRATLVNSAGEVLMDEHVLPYNPITDYNTRYSGITAATLENVTTRLEDVQKRILELVDADTLLCGHALDNDLRSLRLVHANVVDSAALYPHPQGPPYRSGLRALASRYLKRNIQNGSHDSAEDARAAMDLILLKMKHGPSYGTPDAAFVDTLADVLADTPGRSVDVTLVDRQVVLARYATGRANAIPAFSDAQCAELVAKQVARKVRVPVGGGAGKGAANGAAGSSHGNATGGDGAAGPSGASGGGDSCNGAGDAAAVDGEGKAEACTGSAAAVEEGSSSALHQSFVWGQLQELADFYHGRAQLARKRQQQAAASTTPPATSPALDAEPGELPSTSPSTSTGLEARLTGSAAGTTANGHPYAPSTSQLSGSKDGTAAAAAPRAQTAPKLLPKPQRETPLQAQKRQLQELHQQELQQRQGASKAGRAKAARTDAGPQQQQRETPLQMQQRQLQALFQQDKQQQQERQLQALQRAEERRQQEEQIKQQQGQQEDLEALEQQFSQQRLLSVLQQLDRHVGSIHSALPPNSLLIVASGQGDMAECRRLQESKIRRQAGLEEPPWRVEDEEAYAAFVDRQMRALCFAVVKQ